jgi:putative copper resistance protein D
VEPFLYVVRFLHYAAALQLFGVAVFQAALSPAGLRQALHRPAERLALACGWLLLLSGLAWLGLTAANLGQGWADAFNPDILGKVLGATAFGSVWGWRLGIAVLVVLALTIPRLRAWWVLAVLATLALGSLGLVGHAAVGVGAALLVGQTSQVVHLLASGFWIGSLVPLLFCLTQLHRPDHGEAADVALRRFSGLGHLAVALVLATGVLSAWLIVGTKAWPPPFTPYVTLLGVKVAIVLVMICLAIINRYVFVPAIPNGGPGLRRLQRGTIAEIILTGGVLAAVSIFGTLPPV